MRTPIILDDELGLRICHAAKAQGMSMSAFLAEAGSVKLSQEIRDDQPFELIIESGDGPQSGVNLGKTSELLADE